MPLQAELIYQQVKDELPLGSGNAEDASAEAKEKSTFSQSIICKIGNDFILPAFFNGTYTRMEAAIIEQMTSAIFAQSYQCGFCPELASLVFVKALEFEVSECKEQISLTGFKVEREKVYLKDGSQRNRVTTSIEGHHTTVFNRDQEKSKLNIITTWNGVSVIDAWRKGQILEYKEEEHPQGIDLVYGDFEPTTIVSDVRVEANLKPSEWIKYANALMQIKDYINCNFYTWFMEGGRTHHNFEQELQKLNDIFDYKIKTYKDFGTRPFVIRHWRGNTSTLFQERKENTANIALAESVKEILAERRAKQS